MTIPAPAPVQRRSLTEHTYDMIRAAILDGECVPGEVLDVDDIVEAIGASRTPVTSALERLLHEGLLVRRWRLYVIRPTEDEGRQAAATLGLFARHLTDHSGDADAAIAAIRQLDAAGGRGQFDTARTAVERLCEQSGNQVLAGTVLHGLDALLYRAQHANPVHASAAA